MGLDVYLSDGSAESPSSWGDDRVKSAIHPEHMFTPFYLRSSYNSGGFDRVVGNIVPEGTLWHIFAPCGDLDSGRLRPSKTALRAARVNAERVRDVLATVESIGAEFYGHNPFTTDRPEIESDEAAIDTYRRAIAERPANMDAFSNIDGTFFTDEPMKVRAVIPGSGFGGAGVYIVFETDLTSYREAADIVVEFIDNALSMKRPKIVWSY